ncbi:hypothetical protein [Streptomyces spectabilis]|uniref:Uncharacterized protein n=1 Tax=Streptomyces spectabilis TaxID=68270 RepID=A0A516RH26_STRST|nr:hypothetical protein [Streptomyces spectabilis]QDQ14960.1 hypothetical protein FH965_34075 [Streptomyces spectabilis]
MGAARGVRHGVARAARATAALLLCGVVAACVTWASDEWGDTARAQVLAQRTEVQRPRLPNPWWAEKRIEASGHIPVGSPADTPREGSSGEIAVRVERTHEKSWRALVHYRLRLRAADPLANRLRARPEQFAQVSSRMPGGYATAVALHGGARQPGYPSWCTVSQPSARDSVTVTAEHRTTLTGVMTANGLTYAINSSFNDEKGDLVPRVRLPGHWAWRIEVPRGWGLSVTGTPTRQKARTVEFVLADTDRANNLGTVTASLLTSRETSFPAADSPAPRDPPGSSPEALLSLAALAVVACAALAGYRTAPGGGPRAVPLVPLAVAGLAVAVGALLLDSYSTNWKVLSWLWGAVLYSHIGLVSEPLPMESRTQGALLGTVLFVLPVLTVVVSHRRRGARCPAVVEAGVLAAPTAALVLLAWLMGGGTWTRAVVTCLVTATLAACVVYAVLRLRLCGDAARPWAVPIALAAWTAAVSCVVLQVLPWETELATPFTGQWLFTGRSAGASWPLLFTLLVPWVTALLLVVVPLLPPAARIGWSGRLALAAVLVPALLPWWTTMNSEHRPATSDLFAQLAGQWPGDSLVYGVRTIAPAAQVMWCATVAALLAQLYATGVEKGRWGSGARRNCLTLLLFAAAATVIGAPDSWLPYWTTAAALLVAWAGAHLLLPSGRAERARQLHGLSGAAHARLLNSLARALLFAEGRHRFLTSSRGTLADTSLPADSWEEKWQSLRQPTAADAARETARLKAVALGGSAGRTAWSNGVAAAAATALLTLPWTAWTAWQAEGYSGVPESVTVAGAPTCVWLAHGFTYGYLYPWLRGNTPVGKAGWLWAVMSAVQLLLLVPRLRVPQGPTALSVFLILAQSTVMALGLALYWEMRLVRRADLLWGHIRNFRRLSSLATPVSAVLVAAVAAVATVLATTWANNVTAPVETPSPSHSTTTAPPKEP